MSGPDVSQLSKKRSKKVRLAQIEEGGVDEDPARALQNVEKTTALLDWYHWNVGNTVATHWQSSETSGLSPLLDSKGAAAPAEAVAQNACEAPPAAHAAAMAHHVCLLRSSGV